MSVSKFLHLLPLIATSPIEFVDRIATKLEYLTDRKKRFDGENYTAHDWNDVLLELNRLLGKDIRSILSEPGLTEIEAGVRDQIDAKLPKAPFTLAHCSDFVLARMCYALVRAVQPTTVLETGVAFGVTSAFILKALEINQKGTLHSVDLPPLGRNADDFVGILIPARLRHRWELHRGATRRVLPQVLPTLGPVEIFVHDSLHTYSTMIFEFRAVSRHFAQGGILVSDDIQDNAAFHEWVEKAQPAFSAAIREPEKGSLFGLAVQPNHQTCQANY